MSRFKGEGPKDDDVVLLVLAWTLLVVYFAVFRI